MTAQLEICGSSGSRPGALRACSSYLIDTAETKLLIDLGNGALMNYQVAHDVADLDAVVISHLHHDHVADLVGLTYARRFHEQRLDPLVVYAPPGAEAYVRGLILPEPDWLHEQLQFEVLRPGQPFEVGDVRVDCIDAIHTVDARSIGVTVADRRLVYSGDTATNPALVAFAKDADVFLCEATWLDRAGPFPPGIHLSGREAGEHAAAAGAGRLLLTHISPSFAPATIAEEAAGAFDGDIEAAEDRQVYPLGMK